MIPIQDQVSRKCLVKHIYYVCPVEVLKLPQVTNEITEVSVHQLNLGWQEFLHSWGISIWAHTTVLNSHNSDLNHVCVAFIEHTWVYGLCHTDWACVPSHKMTWQGNMIYIDHIGIHESEAMTGTSCRLACAPDRRLTSSIGKLGWD